MQFNCALEPDEHHYYYHQLPDSESPSHKEGDPINKRRYEESWHKGAAELESQKHNAPQGVSVNKKKARLNKYALAGAILASTNSILLGYGEFYILRTVLLLV